MTLETYKQAGWELGSNVSVSADEVPEGYARLIQDGIQDLPGTLRKRGPLRQVVAGTSGRRPHGLVGTYSPGGVFRIAIIEGDGSNLYFTFLADNLTSLSGVSYGIDALTLPTSAYYIVDAKPALGGGLLIGVASTYRERTEAATATAGYHDQLYYWRGARLAQTSTGTLTTTAGSTAVVGVGTSWNTTVEPGMFVFAGGGGGLGAQNRWVGIVSAVTSDTTLTLEFPAPVAYAGQNLIITPVYFMSSGAGVVRTMRGRITCSTSSTTVTGGDTYFNLEALTAKVLQTETGAIIGTVSSVTNDGSLQLVANALVNLNVSKYIATPATSSSGGYPRLTSPAAGNNASVDRGFLNAVWRGRQFYANKNYNVATKPWLSRVWYSLPDHFASVMTTDSTSGQFFDVPSSIATGTPVTGLIGTETALMVFKEDETWAVTGDGPSSWRVDRLLHDGCLNPGSIVPYQNGCIWAGRSGIYYYDGRQIANLALNSLGTQWDNAVYGIDWGTQQMRAFVDRDHYFLHLQSSSASFGPTKNNTTTLPSTAWTLCLNLKTGALSFLTNLNIRGAVKLPAASGGYTYYVVEKDTSGTRFPAVAKSSDLFLDGTVVDEIVCRDGTGSAGVAGPIFYLESRKYTFDDKLRQKWWKELDFWHWNEDGQLYLEVITGWGNQFVVESQNIPTTVTSSPDGTGYVFTQHRIGKRSAFLQYRIYDSTNATRGITTRVKLGAYGCRYKWLREHRV